MRVYSMHVLFFVYCAEYNMDNIRYMYEHFWY